VTASLAGVLPTAVLDCAYDVAASLRHRLSSGLEGRCPIASPDLRSRLLA
jgi:hypothetical protein